jgi:hypothetical protein
VAILAVRLTMAKRTVTPLNDTAIRNAKPKEKGYTILDGNGLQLLIKTTSKKICVESLEESGKIDLGML